MENRQNYAIIVAGGVGSRMSNALPKQFIELHGTPILMHTLMAFYQSGFFQEIVLVLHAHSHELWKELCIQHQFTVPHTLVKGGETRFHSVKNGLAVIAKKDGQVAIHDGVRPLVSTNLIKRCLDAAQLHGNAIPAILPAETVRIGTLTSSELANRSRLWLVQTPQVFNLQRLLQHYQTAWHESLTDDASVAEKGGEKIYMVEGEKENIKITTAVDLTIAESILRNHP